MNHDLNGTSLPASHRSPSHVQAVHGLPLSLPSSRTVLHRATLDRLSGRPPGRACCRAPKTEHEQAALERLAEPGAVTVVTGQQVGLFSGPAYTIYKALTAARIAADLRPADAPRCRCFWLATEDHDWAEVDHAWVFDGSAHAP